MFKLVRREMKHDDQYGYPIAMIETLSNGKETTHLSYWCSSYDRPYYEGSFDTVEAAKLSVGM